MDNICVSCKINFVEYIKRGMNYEEIARGI
jgi:uncharacterized protein YeeX (DUF496 family)